MSDNLFPYSSSDTSNVKGNEENLEEFRRRWKEELQQKKPSQQAISQGAIATASSEISDENSCSEDVEHQESGELDSVLSASRRTDDRAKKNAALELYIKAVTKEREGDIGEGELPFNIIFVMTLFRCHFHLSSNDTFKALKNYRQASKLDPGVEHTYRKYFHNAITGENAENFDVSQSLAQHLKEEFRLSTASHEKDYETRQLNVNLSEKHHVESSEHEKSSNRMMIALLNSLRNMRLAYEPLVLERPRFGLACKKFWVLSREVSLWRYLCQKAYWDVSLTLGTSNLLQEEYVSFYDNDWRRMYIE
ncbi:7112_t:CDS:2, partial [Acaulospora colombiana]